MTRAEYMEELAQALKAYDEDFALDIIGDYRRHFDEAAADGRSEESVCEELGSVEDFIRDIPEEFKKNSDEKASGRTDSSSETSDYKDDFGKLAGDLGKLVNEAGKMAGKAGIAAGKAAIKAAKSADSAISRFSEVISDKLSEVMSDISNDMTENAADDNTADSSNEGAEHTCDRTAQFDNVEVEEYADIDFNKDNISNNVNNNNNSNNNSNVINRDINNSNTINSNVNDSNMNAGTAGAYAGNTALDIVNPLMVCSYTGLRGLKMSVVEPNVELVQADTAAITIILSRPLTKKEKMYMNPIISVEDGILKVKQENKNKAFSFIYNPVNEPLTYFVTVPARFEKLNVSTVSGGIYIQSDIRAESCRLSTVSGGIYVDGDITAEKCRLSTVSGSIKVQHDIHVDKLKLNTVSGQIRTAAQLYAKEQEFSSVSGSVSAVVAGESFSAETVSGSVNVAVIGACSGKVNTVSGGIAISLLSDIGIDIKCSGMSGSLKLMTDKHVVWDNYDEKNTMRFGFAKSDRHAVFGDGQARITSSSVSGSVKVYDFGKTE